MEIKKVALIGAGAIGGYFIQGFEGSSIDFKVIAEGERKERLRSNGVKVNGTEYYPEVMTPREAGVQDLVIIATKYSALDEAINMTDAMTGDNTLVLSVLNGVDSEERVAEKIGKEHVLHSLMRIASRRYSDRIEYQQESLEGVIFGNVFIPGEKGKEAENSVNDMFNKTNVGHKLSNDILYDQWVKYAGNVSSNLPQAVFGCGNGIYEDSEHAAYIRARLWQEVAALAKEYGVIIPEYSAPWAVAKSSRFSTLQDLDAHRKTEIEMFAGVIVRKSKEKGIESPFAEYTYHAISFLEEKNQGRFDYSD